jgi:hypothetical protein
MVKKTEADVETKRANLSFLYLIFPSFLLAIIPSSIGGNVIFPLVFKLIVFGYGYYVTAHFVKSMYN